MGTLAEEQPDPLNRGANLYRAYLLDIVTDPECPGLAVVYKRGDAYPETMSLIRAILNRKPEAEGHKFYLDRECEQPTEFEDHWAVGLVAKVRDGAVRKGGMDREWVKITLARTDLTAEEKLAILAKHT